MDKLKKVSLFLIIVLLLLSIFSIVVYDFLNNRILTIKEENKELSEKLKEVRHNLNENLTELKKLQTGTKYEMHDPTYLEVITFIREDKTNEIPYDDENFDCENYAQSVNDNAEKKGIRCAYVVLYFIDNEYGHSIVGFSTVDAGMIYVEPQTDELVKNLQIGRQYWTQCVIPEAGYYYEDDPNDTIKTILIYW